MYQARSVTQGRADGSVSPCEGGWWRKEAPSGQMEGATRGAMGLLSDLCLEGTLRALSPYTEGRSAQSMAVVTPPVPPAPPPLPESSDWPHPSRTGSPAACFNHFLS